MIRHRHVDRAWKAPRHEDRPTPHDLPAGPHADRKSEPGGAPRHHVPVAAGLEGAHLLANEARDTLHRYGLNDQEILDLADDFVAEDRGEDTLDFEGWAIFEHSVRRHPVSG